MKRRILTAHSTAVVPWSFKAASNLAIRHTKSRCCSLGLRSDPLDLHPHGRCPRGTRNLASHRAERAMLFAFLTSVDCRRSSLAEVSPRVSPARRLFLSWVLSRCRPSAVLASLTRSRSVHHLRCRRTMVPVARRFPGVPRRTVQSPSRVPPAVFLHPRRFSLVKARGCVATRRRPWGSMCFLGAPLNRSTRISPCRHQASTPTPHLACFTLRRFTLSYSLTVSRPQMPPCCCRSAASWCVLLSEGRFPGKRPSRGPPATTDRSVRSNPEPYEVTGFPVAVVSPRPCTADPDSEECWAESLPSSSAQSRLRLWRADPKGFLRTDTRAVFPGGSSHAVREPVPADVFADRVAPAVCKQKMRCALFFAWSAYRPTPVVSDAAIAGSRCGPKHTPRGVYRPLTSRWSRFFTPVRAKRLLPAMGSPPFEGPPSKLSAVRVRVPSRWLPKPPSTPRADLRQSEADPAKNKGQNTSRRDEPPLAPVKEPMCDRPEIRRARRAKRRCRRFPSAFSE